MSNTPLKVEQVGGGRFAVRLDGDWSFGERVNAGYLQRVVAEAAVQVVAHNDPIAVTTDFLTAVKGGPAELTAEPLRLGNSIDTVRVTMYQAGEAVLASSVVIGTLEGKPADMDMSVAADVPSPDRCARIEYDSVRGRRLPLMDRVEIRVAPECIPLIRGHGDGSFAVRGWARFADGGQLDALGCLALADAFPPVTFTLGRHGSAPTVQLTTYLRAKPVDGWLRGELRGRVLGGGWFDQECTLRDTVGNVIAQAHQLVRVPRRNPQA
ncbi:MAG TPA: thioesterase family protein [Mycobacteriales bacterium]|nr:thioesterase family protein [Mycobacteriales bacterium]